MKLTLARKLSPLCLLTAFCAVAAWAQPRPAASSVPDKTAVAQPSATATPTPAPPPATLKAKYEGGVFGYTKKMEGTLNFDEVNSRLVFRTKDGKELLSFPYSSLKLIVPDTKAVRPAAATVASAVPLPYYSNVAAMFIRKKQRYLNFQYEVTDATSSGASFRIDNKELLYSVVASLCEKAQLKSRGQACYR